MCGICGVFDTNGNTIEVKKIESMMDSMHHRGPDDSGIHADGSFVMGMKRLSIIDLDTGKQPIYSEDGRYVVVLNGEIYNYVELRHELIERGHVFKTKTDTEVIVHLFEEKQEKCVEDLNGIFSFCVWDSKERSLFLIRDHIGVKPLFYHFQNGVLSFSSDLTSLRKYAAEDEIDKEAFLSYLAFAFIPYPNCIFKNIKKLSPGHYLCLDAKGELRVESYWDILTKDDKSISSVEECEKNVLDLLKASISRQLRSDVPVATFLSGGIDSSSVVAFLSSCGAQDIRTFSLAFEGGFNELSPAKLVSERYNTVHTEKVLAASDVPLILNQLVRFMDEPVADNSIVPTFVLSQVARAHGVKVILNGSGGDEVFGGYNRHKRSWWKMMLFMIPKGIRWVLAKMVSVVSEDKALKIEFPEIMFLGSGTNFHLFKKLLKGNSHKQILAIVSQLFEKMASKVRSVKDLMRFDLKTYLVDDVLSLLDKMTMAHSLEGRVPLLDHKIVEYVYKIPENLLFCNGKLKGLLRAVVKDYLPKELFDQPKRGFSGPTAHWVNGELRDVIYKELFEERIDLLKDLLDVEVLREEFLKEEMSVSSCETIFSIYVFILWHKKMVNGKVNG